MLQREDRPLAQDVHSDQYTTVQTIT